ncbi:MAG: IS5 family transposase [Candidatus Reddybacter sp.]
MNERDPLTALKQLIEWESFELLERIRNKKRKSTVGRKPFDAVLMLKALVSPHLYNLSNDALEFQIRDRYNFFRFLDLKPEGRGPDTKTIWLFREQLMEHNLIKELHEEFALQLQSKGFKIHKGQIIDAGIVDAPKLRNSREENAQIKAGDTPERFKQNPHVQCQKDIDARWTKKNNDNRYSYSYSYSYSYKNDIAVDAEHKLTRELYVSSAEVHDSQALLDMLSENKGKGVWAGSAYWRKNFELTLWAMSYCSHIHQKGTREKPLAEKQQASNR